MGEQVISRAFTYADRREYRAKLRQCLDALYLLVDEDRFDVERTLTGVELELCLVDADGNPAQTNAEVLAHLAQGPAPDGFDVTDELGKFNLELNLAPRSVYGNGFADYEDRLRAWLGDIDASANQTGSSVVMVGTLPTLGREHATADALSVGARYMLLNEQILAARGEEITLDITGAENLRFHADSIAPESANTSVQFHLQLTCEQFPRYWNAAQAIAGVQLATSANSPYLYGSRLWAETRIVLFEQATDTRSRELRVQGVRPRTFFGEKWISTPMELFEENLRYFPPLLPLCDTEDPAEVMAKGEIPNLRELRLHNGTIYRWNRPVYDIGAGGPHLRVENRVVPAGPTPADVCANMAFYLGLVTALAESENPIWTKLPFSVAERNFAAAARQGIAASQVWPGVGEIEATALVTDLLLPMAADGLDRLAVDSAVADRLLSIIEGRCAAGVNGASWQVDCVEQLQDKFQLPRTDALREMTRRYQRYAATNTPVHEWPAE